MPNLPNINNCSIAVIGLGYVGLPVAVEFARNRFSILDNELLNRNIIGFDVNKERIEQLKKDFDKTREIDTETLKDIKNILFTSNVNELTRADIFIVTVPTPIDKNKIPDLTLLKKACKTIGNAIKENKSDVIPVVIFESTVYPGATEEICIPIIKSTSNRDIFSNTLQEYTFAYGYSPERINPGDENHKLSMIVKVTSGNNEEVAELVNKFYGSIIKAGTYKAKSIKVAEAAKVIENTQRDLNIALINELSIIFKNLNIDTLDIIEAAKTKWNFLPFMPGLVGGHCIGVDPYYLTYKSKQIGYNPEVILSGRKINNNMGSFYIKRVIEEVQNKGLKKKDTESLLLGFTFKENCTDIRNTGSMQIVNALKANDMNFIIVDPHADKKEALVEYGVEVKDELPKNTRFSVIIVSVAHEYFTKIDLDTWQSLCTENTTIFDLKGIVPNNLNPIRP